MSTGSIRISIVRSGSGSCKFGAGFTLVEMMIVLVILAVLLVLAAPTFTQSGLTTRLKSYSNLLVSSVHLARGEAIKRNTDVSLCVSNPAGTACTTGGWEQGWIVQTVDGTVLLHQQALDEAFKLTGSVDSLTLGSTGLSSTPANFKVCRSNPVGAQERVVDVTATGKARISTTELGTCP
ncbi:MAG: GspH/FimT family pseudopilin [Halioglobus sp.]